MGNQFPNRQKMEGAELRKEEPCERIHTRSPSPHPRMLSRDLRILKAFSDRINQVARSFLFVIGNDEPLPSLLSNTNTQ